MSRARKVILTTLVVLAIGIAGGLIYAEPLLRTATGYAAHNACAVRLVAGRGPDAPAADLPSNPVVPLLRVSVEPQTGTARASVLGLFGSTAFHSTGLGCTLADSRPALQIPADVEDDREGEWPTGERVPAPDQVGVTLPSGAPAAIEAALDAAFVEADPQGRVRGTRAVVIVHQGRIIAERYAEGFDVDTPQLGWSMAKSVTSAMVGRLVADDVVALDDDQLLPAWTGERGAITVDDLLRMSSGLAWDEAYALGSTITEMLYLQPDMGAFAAAQPLVDPPGTVQRYSSGTTNILCDVLDARTNMGPALAHELVFAPLGMASAVLEPDASGGPVCSSYLWATPRDWARFGLWFAQDGVWEGRRLLPERWIEEATTLADQQGEDEGFAAHWWVNTTRDGSPILPEAPADTYWAAGHDGQRIFIVPSADLVAVRLGFTPDIPSAELGFGSLIGSLVSALAG